MGQTLSENLSKYGYRIPTGDAPFCLIRLASLFRGDAKMMVKYWGQKMACNNQRSKDVLGIEYRPIEESMVEMAETMMDMGTIEDKRDPTKSSTSSFGKVALLTVGAAGAAALGFYLNRKSEQ